MADGTSNQGPIKTRASNGWTLCAGCPVRQQEPSEKALVAAMDAHDGVMRDPDDPEAIYTLSAPGMRAALRAAYAVDLRGRADTAQGGRVPHPKIEPYSTDEEYAAPMERSEELRRGRPDTAEGEIRTKVSEITERMAHKFWNHRTTAEDGLAFARELRAALRVGGAQKDNG